VPDYFTGTDGLYYGALKYSKGTSHVMENLAASTGLVKM